MFRIADALWRFPGQPTSYKSCLLDKSPNLLQVFGVAAVVSVGPGFRIHPRWADCADGFGDIVGSKSACNDHRDAHALDDLFVGFPAVGDAQRSDLFVAR